MKFSTTLLFSAIVFASCNQSDKSATPPAIDSIPATVKDSAPPIDTGKYIVAGPNSEKENKILDAVSKLPEYKKSNAYLDSLTGHKHGLASMIFKPTADEKDYYVRVGFNGDDRFETYYNFYVDSNTLKIKISDVIEGDIVSLDEWRKREKNRK